MKFLSNILVKAGLIVEGTTDLQGTATALTPATSDNTTKIATTAFVKAQGYLTGSSQLDWNNVINRPTTLSGYGITDGVPSSRTITINGTSQDLSANRTFSVGTVTSVAALTLGTSGTDLSSSVANGTTTPVITLNVPTASATNRGALSSADWTTFNNKQNAITLTTTGSSGSSTLVGATLNIPTYTLAGLGGISLTSLSAFVPLIYNNTTGQFSIIQSNSINDGYLSATDWTTFNNKVGGSGTSGQVSYFNGTNSITSSPTFAFTPTSQLLVNNSVTAASAIARGINATPTLTAAANNDVLVGLDINPTFSNGAFTGVTNNALRVTGISQLNGNVNTTGTINATATTDGFYTHTFTNSSTGTSAVVRFLLQGNDGGGAALAIERMGSNYVGTGARNAGRSVILAGSSGLALAASQSGGDIRFYTGDVTAASERMRLSVTNGNLLINTTTDAGFRLDVNGSVRFGANNTSNDVLGSLNFRNGSNAAYIQQENSTNRSLQIPGTGGEANWIFRNTGIGRGLQGQFNSGNFLLLGDFLNFTTSLFAGTNIQFIGASGTQALNNRNIYIGNAVVQYSDEKGYNIRLLAGTGGTAGSDRVGGDIYLTPGAGGGVAAAGNVILAHTGSASQGNVMVGSATNNGARLQVSGSITAASAIARGVNFTNTLVAAANNDVLVGLDVNPTFTNGAFTGVTNTALRVQGLTNIRVLATNFNSVLTVENTGTAAQVNKNVATFIGARGNASNIDDNTCIGILQRDTTVNNFGVFNFFNSAGNLSAFFGAQYTSHAAGTGNFIIGTSNAGVNATKITVFNTGNTVIQNGGTFTDAGFRLDVNGTARVQSSAYFATSAGSVGIGTTSPTGRLTIQRASTGASTDIDFLNEAGQGPKARIRFGGTNEELSFWTGGTASERMRIANDGNVMIGTTTAGGRFTIQPDNNQVGMAISGSSLTGSNAQSLVSLSQTWNTTGNPTAFLLNITNTASGATADLMDLQVGGASRFEITAAGRARLGAYGSGTITGTATYNLAVDASGNVIEVTGGGGGGGIGGSGTTNYIPKFTASTTLGNSLIFDTGTAIVIGNGQSSATPQLGLIEGTDGSGTNIAGAEFRIQGGQGTGTGAGGVITFYTSAAGTSGSTLNSAAERMRIDAAGNVGIVNAASAWAGTNINALQIGNASIYRAGNFETGYSVNTYYDGTNFRYISTGIATNYTIVNGVHAWQAVASGTAGATFTWTRQMTLDASGNLGLGTTTIGSRLQVNGNAAIGYSASTAAPTNGLAVAGNVGIGIAAAATNLHVYRTTAGLSGMQVSNLTHGSTITDGMFVGVDDTQGYIYMYENLPIQLSTNSTVRLFINNDGTVFVGGTNAPASPTTGILSGSGATGTNIAGAELRIRGGASTGNAAGGAITFYTSTAGTTGSTANAATERMRLSAGNFLINQTTSLTGVTNSVELTGAGNTDATQQASYSVFANHGTFAANTGYFVFNKSRGTTAGSVTAVASGDRLGMIRWNGADGTAQIRAAEIYSEVDGTPGTNDMPGRIVFATTLDGASSPTERMRITNSGTIGVNTQTIGSTLQINGNAAIGYNASTAAPTNGLMVAGNVGVNVTPSAWASGFRAIQIGARTAVYNSDINWTGLSNNTFYDGVTYKYITTAQASTIELGSGVITFGNAPSGTAGTTITGTERMRIDTDGIIYVGNAPIAASPNTGIISATGGTGTNIAGAEFRIRGGASTGSANGGAITFYTSTAGASGTTVRAGTEKMRITSDGQITLATGANVSAIAQTGYSLTGSNASSLIDLAGTWNTTGNPTAIKLNITNTASGASAYLMDLQVGGTTQFRVAKDGAIRTTAPTGGTADNWKFGTKVASSVVLDDNDYLEVEVGGTLYRVALVNLA